MWPSKVHSPAESSSIWLTSCSSYHPQQTGCPQGEDLSDGMRPAALQNVQRKSSILALPKWESRCLALPPPLPP